MTIISENRSFGGVQRVYKHDSKVCHCEMNIGVYLPPTYEKRDDLPALVFLSGLTCTEQNFITKAGAQRLAAKLGLVLIAPDTSPRGDDIPDEPDRYDLGKGAGFYVDATQSPWSKNYKMESYIRDELTGWMQKNLPINIQRVGILGHSMGGHGALTLHLKNPDLYKTCSAFSPIVAPSQVQWGQDAFKTYLGSKKTPWKAYDATDLVKKAPTQAHILIDQGLNDQFLDTQLKPELFVQACKASGQSLTLRMQGDYDHSYYFISTFIADHLQHHSRAL